jgi:hypothetical protein
MQQTPKSVQIVAEDPGAPWWKFMKEMGVTMIAEVKKVVLRAKGTHGSRVVPHAV